jgi:hypothetical protein
VTQVVCKNKPIWYFTRTICSILFEQRVLVSAYPPGDLGFSHMVLSAVCATRFPSWLLAQQAVRTDQCLNFSTWYFFEN